MSRPIALLTDFGLTDAYVGTMKGVILSRCPDARIIDLTHGIPPQDVVGGALQLLSAVRFLPPDTVFLAVVDPGVGGARRPICLRHGPRLFVGPDNGLLWPAAAVDGSPEAIHLSQSRYWLPRVSATFHGRDIFAPVAAFLAQGRSPDDLGPEIDDVVRLEFPRPRSLQFRAEGEVIYVDRYGNAITNLSLVEAGHLLQPVFQVGEHRLRPVTHYGAVPIGEPLVLLGSMDQFEIAVNGGSAAEKLGLRVGSPVAIQGSHS